MSKRLQVLLEEKELRQIQRIARAQRTTVAEWVRQALRAAQRHAPSRDVSKKIAAVRAAAIHSYPAGELGQMLDEIERGYLREQHVPDPGTSN